MRCIKTQQVMVLLQKIKAVAVPFTSLHVF